MSSSLIVQNGINKIFLMGLTSSALGGMEYHNLGNYAIMEPLVIYLKKNFPEAKIVTSIQMSAAFCEKFGVECKREKRFWTYGRETAVVTLKDICRLSIWVCFHYLFRMDCKFMLNKSSLLCEIHHADLVVDFSGDMFGDNSSYSRFLEACAELLFAKILEKPTVILAGSPGPFKKRWRRWLAKLVMNHMDLITNREPLSTELLKKMGVRDNKMFTTACPAFLFKPKSKDEVWSILQKENIISGNGQPLVGIILCGWNMPNSPYNKIPRNESELLPFVAVIKHLIERMNMRVLLMSHQNRTDEKNRLIRGNDHAIIDQIIRLLENEGYGNRLFTLKDCYDAATSKAIISCFDLLISGRIHGAIAGLSQCVPTVIIDYGHEPKAHKLKGFARLVGLEEYLCDPRDSEGMIQRIEKCWENKDQIHEHLREKIEKIKQRSQWNFELLKTVGERKKLIVSGVKI